MHFSIPDTSDLADDSGSSYTVFNIHINGVYHCSVRYREFHSFHEQLKKEFGQTNLPTFPPKKLLSLSAVQLEERRAQLERYVQLISQKQEISNGNTFNDFLLQAQQRSQKEKAENVKLDVYLMNGHKISVNIVSTDQTDDVLESVASQIQLPDDLVYYFALFLVKKEEGVDNAIVRKLQEFESPFISLKAANKTVPHRIVVRKNFWDSSYEEDLIDNRIAMNLLYVQAVNDIARGWVLASKEQHKQLKTLQDKNSKKEYLNLAKTLKYYGHLQFHPCICDYPEENTRVIAFAGNRELTLTLRASTGGVTENAFKVTRMRCWRITSSYPDSTPDTTSQYSSKSTASDVHNGGLPTSSATPFKLELSFEYLVAKDTLQWITITSDQAILMSMCLQGMVDELIMKKKGTKRKRPQDRSNRRRNSSEPAKMSKPASTNGTKSPAPLVKQVSQDSAKKNGAVPRSPVKSSGPNPVFKRSISTASQGATTENEVFEREDGIGDDDL